MQPLALVDVGYESHDCMSVELHVGVDQPIRPSGATPSQQRPNAREQLIEAERLRQIVVRACVQTEHDVILVTMCGQEKYRHRRLAGAEATNDLEARLAREHDVEYEQVVVVHVRLEQTVGAVVRDVDGVSLLTEPLLEEARDLLLVFNYQDSQPAACVRGWSSGRTRRNTHQVACSFPMMWSITLQCSRWGLKRITSDSSSARTVCPGGQ